MCLIPEKNINKREEDKNIMGNCKSKIKNIA